MQIHIQLFSFIQDCLPAGTNNGRAIITLSHEKTTLSDLVKHLGIDRQLGINATDVTSKAGWVMVVNGHARLDMSYLLQEGDHVKIFPPMAGG